MYFTESLEEKRDTCTSTTVRKNLHLDQEWHPDLYWSLVLCNSPKKTCVNNLSGQDLYHRVYSTESLAEKRDTVINNSKEKLTFRSRVVSWFVLVSDSVQLTYKRYLVLIIYLGKICIRVYFIGRKKGYMYINNNKDKLTFRSRVVSWFVLVSDSVQLTYKKYLVLIICLGIICIRVYFRESLAEKRDTCTSTTVKINLHLEQEWCPDLYWSLVLCNSPIKNIWR